MKNYLLFILLPFLIITAQNQDQKQLMIRCDDIGMSHSVNMAAQKIIETGIPFSASVMFACPWYQEAVDLLKNQTQVSVGIHLTLNAEWKNYRWGPVAGKDAVPGLVDEHGYFFPSRAALYENNPSLEDIAKELRAQIERAKKSRLNIEYVDYHMGTAVDKPEYRAVVEKLAREYGLAISRYFGEVDVKSMYSATIENKIDTLLNTISNLETSKLNLLVCHIGVDNPELAAMTDLNEFGLANMSKHRNAELNALLSDEFNKALSSLNIRLLTYSDLIREIGLDNMKSPLEIENGVYK